MNVSFSMYFLVVKLTLSEGVIIAVIIAVPVVVAFFPSIRDEMHNIFPLECNCST